MSQAFADWCDDNLTIIRKRGNDNWVLDRCFICGKAGKLEVNVSKKVWRCWSCDSRGGAVALVAEITGATWAEARRLLKSSDSPLKARKLGSPRRLGVHVPASSSSGGDDVTPSATFESGGGDIPAELLSVPLPAEFVPCYEPSTGLWRIPDYLRERGVSRFNLKRFGVGFCNAGRYKMRVIVPVQSLGMQTFVARAVEPGVEPKYLTPGGFHARILFAYDHVEPGESVIIVEGVFDALRCWRYGLRAIALQGKELSEDQAALVRRLAPREVVVALDADAAPAAHRVAGAFLLDCPVRVARLPAGSDPGDLGQAALTEIVAGAGPTSGRLDALGAALAELRDL